MRVNARLDEERERKLKAISEETGQSVSEVLKSAIDAYHAQVTASSARTLGLLEQVGFIGCAEGPADLSDTYKEELVELLVRKHDPR